MRGQDKAIPSTPVSPTSLPFQGPHTPASGSHSWLQRGSSLCPHPLMLLQTGDTIFEPTSGLGSDSEEKLSPLGIWKVMQRLQPFMQGQLDLLTRKQLVVPCVLTPCVFRSPCASSWGLPQAPATWTARGPFPHRPHPHRPRICSGLGFCVKASAPGGHRPQRGPSLFSGESASSQNSRREAC